METFDVMIDGTHYKNCFFKISRYKHGGGLALTLSNDADELDKTVTANLNAVPEGMQYVDAENRHWSETLLLKLGVGESVHRSVNSLYYQYPLYKFDMKRLHQYGYEAPVRKENCAEVIGNLIEDYGILPVSSEVLRDINTSYAVRKMHITNALPSRMDRRSQKLKDYSDLFEFLSPFKDKKGRLVVLSCTNANISKMKEEFIKLCDDVNDPNLELLILEPEKYKPLKNGKNVCIVKEKDMIRPFGRR